MIRATLDSGIRGGVATAALVLASGTIAGCKGADTSKAATTPSSMLVGPENIADVAPPVGNYSVYLKPYVLSDNAINTIVGGVQDYYAGYFYMLGYCDLNGDNVVDGKDYVLVKKAVGALPGTAKWYWPADVNCSNSVTVADYQLVKTKIPTVYPVA